MATPFTAATVWIPDSAAPVGFVPIAIVTEFVALATTLSLGNAMPTLIDGAITRPVRTLTGWTRKTSLSGSNEDVA